MSSFLFVDTERVWRGGQDQLLALLGGLYRRGHSICLVCHPGTLLESRARAMGVNVRSVPIRSELGPVSFFRLLLILLRVRPQILAFNTPKPIFMGTLASRLTPVRVRIVFRRVNFPLRKGLLTRIKYSWGIDCIIAISESIRQELERRGLRPFRIRTIYEGMDLSHFPRRARLSGSREPGQPAVVGTIAHLSPEKGLEYLIEAAALIPGVRQTLRFVVVGEGECRGALEALAGQKGLSDIFRFPGFQPEASQLMSSFDIFALPSLSEGLSSAILEAMASSLPIVATRVGGIPELVIDGDNGLLVPPADSAALARAIKRLAEDPRESDRMGLRGRQRMEEQFTLERKISETESLCTDLLEKSARSGRPSYV